MIHFHITHNSDKLDLVMRYFSFSKLMTSIISLGVILSPTLATAADMDKNQADMAMIDGQNRLNQDGSSGLYIALDRAKVLRITQPVSTIVIGNPSIADASLPDEKTLILTGRSYGETNILMLDEDGTIVADYNIFVGNRSDAKIAVYRGAQRSTVACNPTCEPSPTLGDNNESFNQGLSQIQARNGIASGFANGTPTGPGQ
jgi:hypothetical protein